jgi:hypothetical protein
LWEGIFLPSPTSNLIATRTVIEDAHVGVRSVNNGYFQISDSCHLLNNYIHIDIQNTFEPFQGFVIGSTLEADDYLLHPFETDITYRAIQIMNAEGVIIGRNNSLNQRNKIVRFSDAGIHHFKSSLKAVNCEITNEFLPGFIPGFRYGIFGIGANPSSHLTVGGTNGTNLNKKV